MTITQKRKILRRISEIENELEEMKKTRSEIAAGGYNSATMSSGGGSRSYTHISLREITEAISALTSEMKKLKALLRNVGQQGIWKNVLVVYDL